MILFTILYLYLRYKMDILTGFDPPPIKVIILMFICIIAIFIYFVTNKRLLEVDEFHRKLRMKRQKTSWMSSLALLFIVLGLLALFFNQDGLFFFFMMVGVLIMGVWLFYPKFLFKK